ncbi:MAG: hypothetical protein ACYC4B_22950 [Pirellulaceae bacterium]
MPSHRNVAETETHPVFVSRVAKQHEPLNGRVRLTFNGGPTLPATCCLTRMADRYLCSYVMIALAREQDVDAVVRQHRLRITDFRRGQSLGKEDHLARWPRPERPTWMDMETYEQMPEFLDVRELRMHVHQPGFRTEAFVVVTTLMDHQTYHMVRKEIGTALSAYNLIRKINLEAAYAADVSPWSNELHRRRQQIPKGYHSHRRRMWSPGRVATKREHPLC